jgi:hypothetical protein
MSLSNSYARAQARTKQRYTARQEADYWRAYCAPHKKKWLFYRKMRWAILSHPFVSPGSGLACTRKMTSLFRNTL